MIWPERASRRALPSPRAESAPSKVLDPVAFWAPWPNSSTGPSEAGHHSGHFCGPWRLTPGSAQNQNSGARRGLFSRRLCQPIAPCSELLAKGVRNCAFKRKCPALWGGGRGDIMHHRFGPFELNAQGFGPLGRNAWCFGGAARSPTSPYRRRTFDGKTLVFCKKKRLNP